MDIKIDPEFRDIIPALTSAEFEQLEKNLLAEGCREKIILWNGFVIDGHNRYTICDEHDIAFEIHNMDHFEDRHAVIDWMIQNQIGKRNLTGGTISYLRGLKLKREKQRRLEELAAKELEAAADEPIIEDILETADDAPSEEPADETASQSSEADEPVAPTRTVADFNELPDFKEHEAEIAEDVAKMYQISPSTLKKDERFTDAIDTIRTNVGRDIQDKILNKELKLNPIEIVSISKMDKVDQQELMSGKDEEILERLAEVKREKQDLNLKKSLIKLDEKLNFLNGLPVNGEFFINAEEDEVILTYEDSDGDECTIDSFKGTAKLTTFLDGFIKATSLFAVEARSFGSAVDEEEEDEA